VITSSEIGIQDFYKEKNFYVHRISFHRKPIIGTLLFWLSSVKMIRKINPEIIHAQIIGNAIPALLSKVFFKIPYVVHGRGSDVYGKWRGKNLLSNIILNNADGVLAQTEHMKLAMEQMCHRFDIQIIPNGHDIEITRKDRITTDKEFVILFAGSLRPVKGVKYLISAIKILVEKKINVKLIILGDGEDRVSLENLVQKEGLTNYVTFVGYRPHEEVMDFMRNSDIFVLPSLSEGFPNVLLEAMATGSCIITTNVTGVSEIITDGENGILVEPGNSEMLGENILRLYYNEDLRKKISNGSLKTADNYLWSNIVKRLEGIYLSILYS